MKDYNYWIEHVQKFIEEFGSNLGIDYCELRIDDFIQNYPQEIFSVIQMPNHYLYFLNLHSNMILCNKNLCKGIGRHENEDLDTEDFDVRNYILNIREFLERKKNFYYKVPNDERRKEYAALLRDLMTLFTIYHEIGHVRQRNHSQKLDGQDSNEAQDNWTSQAEEIDADVFAIDYVWRTVFNNFHQFKPNSTLATTTELLSLALYSTFIFFYLSNNDEELNIEKKKHPHPIVRFSIISHVLQQIVQINELCKNEDFDRIVESVLRDFDLTLTYHFNSDDNSTYFNRFFDPENRKVRERLGIAISQNPALYVNTPKVI